MEILYKSCCGLDVHKKMIVACLRLTNEGGKVSKQVRTFGTMTADLLALRTGWWQRAARTSRWRAPAFTGSRCTTCWKGSWSC